MSVHKVPYLRYTCQKILDYHSKLRFFDFTSLDSELSESDTNFIDKH